MKNILLLGSTGSIGKQTLEIVDKHPDKFSVVGLTCKKNINLIKKQIIKYRPLAVCVDDEKDATYITKEFPNLEVFVGENGLIQITHIECDIVLNALMGISGLAPTYEAIKCGRDIALANKETLVAGGNIIMDQARKKGVKILPVDSEHSAIFQCLEGNKSRNVRRILLTASGGPFRGKDIDYLKHVTLKQALKHPNWSMGQKITIDSATMMNKGLEVIEAYWLFGIPTDKIDVHVHPESIVHSMVEFEDTSIIAQLGLPDMKIPISLALAYPERLPLMSSGLDMFTTGANLTFERPNLSVFRCLKIAYDSIRAGGSAPVVMNGANEELVSLFLQEKINFLDIQNKLADIMEENNLKAPSDIDEIIEIDKVARRKVVELIYR